jgi:2-C-methyl-D-erythritol 4-phosphate cytidylyltransferase
VVRRPDPRSVLNARGHGERGQSDDWVPPADTWRARTTANASSPPSRASGCGLAQTPQMFRHGTLLRALGGAAVVTDEAAAVEALGLKPRLVPGSPRNLKVTYPEDVALASLVLGSSA